MKITSTKRTQQNYFLYIKIKILQNGTCEIKNKLLYLKGRVMVS